MIRKLKQKKGQAATYAIAFMLALTLIILGLSWAKPINEVTKSAMNETVDGGEIGSGMNCSNSLLDDYTKAGCIVTDLGQSYFIGSILAIAGILIAARIIFAQ